MYSVIGILASIVLFITNRDCFLPSCRPAAQTEGEQLQNQKLYRIFLFGVLSFYLTDALWGIFDRYKLTGLQVVDTSLYFFSME